MQILMNPEMTVNQYADNNSGGWLARFDFGNSTGLRTKDLEDLVEDLVSIVDASFVIDLRASIKHFKATGANPLRTSKLPIFIIALIGLLFFNMESLGAVMIFFTGKDDWLA
ncbi:hypothetical protein DM860_014586 [Cuscuta australis]|uniref:Uncharacterized protein n=1 Tax=Cuscuta australis TaxID=267555 RepID=A0A328DIA1_9ASTE|nr:hypothetical protein DM860_014586 [Cuscuta australis]